MALKKGYLSNRNELILKSSRLGYSLVFGLITSFVIYSFFCLIRLVFRSMEMGLSNGPLILDSSTRYWQNFNFAIVAILLANFLFMGSVFKKPAESKISFVRRNEIMNNQVFLGFNFFYVFTKLFLILGVFSIANFDYRLMSNYTCGFALLGLVFFLESWKTVLRSFGKKCYKMFFICLTIISALPFLYANTSVFNYQKIDQMLLVGNPVVPLPHTEYRIRPRWPSATIKIVKEGGNFSYYIDNKKSSYDSLIKDLRQDRPVHHYYAGPIYLLAPSNLPIGELKRLEKWLFLNNEVRVFYVTRRIPPKLTGRFDLYGIPKQLYFNNSETKEIERELPQDIILPPPRPDFNVPKSDARINVYVEDELRFGNKVVHGNELYGTFRASISANTTFNLVYEKEITFQRYISVYANYRHALDDIREEHLQFIIGRALKPIPKYSREYERHLEEVMTKFPFKLLENLE